MNKYELIIEYVRGYLNDTLTWDDIQGLVMAAGYSKAQEDDILLKVEDLIREGGNV